MTAATDHDPVVAPRHPNAVPRRRNNTGGADVTTDEIADLAQLLAEKTSLGAVCSNMQLRSALEFLKGRGYLRKPPDDHVTPTRRSEPA
jgi:hypothetical protein